MRAARQQEFVGDLKAQAGGSNLLGKLKSLVKIFAKTTETDGDLQSNTGLLRLIDLLVFSQHHAIVSIHFPAAFVNVSTGSSAIAGAASLGDYVTASPGPDQGRRPPFMHADAIGPKKVGPPKAAARRTGGRARRAGVGRARLLRPRRRLSQRAPRSPAAASRAPARVPAVRAALAHRRRGSTRRTRPTAPSPNVYVLKDRPGTRTRPTGSCSSRTMAEGRYYGVAGDGLEEPADPRPEETPYRVGGRTLQLVGDGYHLRFVVWRTKQRVYWISNTLTLDLTNRQMIGIARSLTKRLR